MTNKKKKQGVLGLEVKRLTYAYTFLLSAAVIFIISLKSFDFNVFGNNISYAVFIMPFLYFIVDIILKEIGYKPARIAILVSTVVVYFTAIVVDIMFGAGFNLLSYVGLTVAYFVSQFLNLSIYYYMLDNYKTPLFLVIFNLIFCLLVNNMIYLLFSLNMVFTDTFWNSYLLIVLFQSLISIVLAFIVNLVQQGLDVEE